MLLLSQETEAEEAVTPTKVTLVGTFGSVAVEAEKEKVEET